MADIDDRWDGGDDEIPFYVRDNDYNNDSSRTRGKKTKHRDKAKGDRSKDKSSRKEKEKAKGKKEDRRKVKERRKEKALDKEKRSKRRRTEPGEVSPEAESEEDAPPRERERERDPGAREKERGARRDRDRPRDKERASRKQKESRDRRDRDTRGKEQGRASQLDSDDGSDHSAKDDGPKRPVLVAEDYGSDSDWDDAQPKMYDFGIPKARVKRGGEEISCSVEETNRIRAILGLKPLAEAGGSEEKKKSADEIAVENMRKVKEEESRRRELAEIEARIARARKKRLLNEKLEGKRLGEIEEGEEEIVSASDWVQRSRQKAAVNEEERLLAEKRARLLEEQEESEESDKEGAYSTRDLTGLEVAHEMKDIVDGETVVLTLQDTEILSKDDHGVVKGLAENKDVLENVNIRDVESYRSLAEKKKKAARGDYTGYDDDEFEEGAQIGPGARRKVLSKYDEESNKGGAKVVLGHGGQLVDVKDEMEVDEGNSMLGSSRRKIAESLKVEKQAAMEYYTADEAAIKFKKRKVKKKDGKVKKLRRKKKKEDIEDLIAETEQYERGRNAQDHGKRSRQNGSNSKELEQAIKNEARFQRANEKAEERFAEKQSQMVSKADKEEPEFFEDLDPDLSVSLARARRLVQKKESQAVAAEEKGEAAAAIGMTAKRDQEGGGTRVKDPAKLVKQFVDQTGGRVREEEPSEDPDTVMEMNEKEQESDSIVFTSTMEFTSRLQSRLEQRARDRELAAQKAIEKEARTPLPGSKKRKKSSAGTASEKPRRRREEEDDGGVEETKGEERVDQDGWTKVYKAHEDNEPAEEEEEEDSDDDEQMAYIHKQPLVKAGMAATLALLQTTGDLKERPQAKLFGRAHDERDFHYENALEEKKQTGKKEIKIEYRDEYGNELTRKEAFRQLSYKFHGHGPGTKKKTKRLKTLEMDKQAKNFTGELESMKNLKKTQEATKKHFVVLSGGNNAAASIPSVETYTSKKRRLSQQPQMF